MDSPQPDARPEAGPGRGCLHRFAVSRYPWAIGAGLVLASAYPKIGVAGLAWIAPALILLSAFGKPAKQTFRIGYAAGLAHYLTTLYWLLLIPVPWVWSWAKVLGWLALGGFLALFTGTWTWGCWKIFPREVGSREADGGGRRLEVGKRTSPLHEPSDPHPSPLPSDGRGRVAISETASVVSYGDRFAAGVQDWAARFLSAPWPLRTSWVIACAALWVALEMVMARIFGGFPWNFLGASQYRMTPLIQIASFTGEYGLSFVIVWASVSLVGAGAVIIRQPTRRSAWVGEIMLPMLTVTALYLAGYVKLLRPEPVVPELSVALVQPSIPQTLVWDQAENDRRFQDLLKLSERALSNQTDLLIWPESAVPSMFRYDKAVGDPIIALARTHKVWMIINSDDADYSPKDTNYFNSAFLISPDGRLVADYKKQHLVIFGEYVPLTGALPFLKWLTPITGGFTPGTKAARFVLADLGVETSVLICYEDAFATLARAAVDDDTDFLVNLTNDGWFGEGAGQWQHAANAVFRTVENGVPLIRCTNTGLTCWVDANGRIRDVLVAATHGVYGTGFMNIQVPLLPPGTRRVPTFYHQHGDWFGWACVALAALRLLGARRRAA